MAPTETSGRRSLSDSSDRLDPNDPGDLSDSLGNEGSLVADADSGYRADTPNADDMTVTLDDINVEEHLRSHGVTPTRQRLQIAGELLQAPVHLSADAVHARVRAAGANVSRATVYNTLSLLVERGLIRQVVVDAGRVFYDSNTAPHHHFFDTDAGELIDIPLDEVAVSGLPELPSDKQLDGIDVIVRVSSRQ